MRPHPSRFRLLLLSGILLGIAVFTGLALHQGHFSIPPAPVAASVHPATPSATPHSSLNAVLPTTTTQRPVPAGIVCRSPHFTLTAQIHAGS